MRVTESISTKYHEIFFPCTGQGLRRATRKLVSGIQPENFEQISVLAWMYDNGVYFEYNIAKALILHIHLAKHEQSAESLYRLGNTYHFIGLSDAALDRWEEAAKYGHLGAISELASNFVESNKSRARETLEKCSEDGFSPARLHLGRLVLAQGKTVENREQAARHFLTSYTELNDASGLFELAMLRNEFPDIHDIPGIDWSLKQILQLGTGKGCRQCMGWLGEHVSSSHFGSLKEYLANEDFMLGVRYLFTAALRGEQPALAMYGARLLAPKNTRWNACGVRALARAAKGGEEFADWLLGSFSIYLEHARPHLGSSKDDPWSSAHKALLSNNHKIIKTLEFVESRYDDHVESVLKSAQRDVKNSRLQFDFIEPRAMENMESGPCE